MNRPNSGDSLMIPILVLIIVVVAYAIAAQRNCARRGGILLRNAWNWPTCVVRGSER